MASYRMLVDFSRPKLDWNLERPQESFFQSSHELLSIDKAVIGQRSLCVTAQSDIMERNQFQNQF